MKMIIPDWYFLEQIELNGTNFRRIQGLKFVPGWTNLSFDMHPMGDNLQKGGNALKTTNKKPNQGRVGISNNT